MFLPLFAWSQEAGQDAEIDSLFDSSSPGVVSEAGTGSVLGDIAKKRSFDFSISVESFAVGALGWADWPLSGAISGVDTAGGFDGIFKASFDARPDASTRIHGFAEYDIPTAAFTLDELFVDRDFGNRIFIRAGKQVIGWGRGSIFKIGDLLDITDESTAGSFAVKAFLPAGKAGFTAVGYYEAIASSVYSLVNANGALRAEYATGKTGVDFSGLLHGDGSGSLTAGAGTSLGGADLFAETRADYASGSLAWKGITAGFMKEWVDPRLVITGEYRYKADSLAGDIPAGHYSALAAGWKPATVHPLKLGVQWLHCAADGSGSLAALLKSTPFPGVDVELAVPFSYGDSGSAYGLKLPANWDLPLSWEKRLSLILKISTTVSY